MLNLFFNRFSWMVVLMEIIGIILFPFVFIRAFISEPSAAGIAFFMVVAGEYLFIRYCATRRWHPDAPRYSGIELHLKKSMVATSYIIAIFGALALLSSLVVSLIVESILLAIVAHINVILLHLHRKDCDTAPANAFSGSIQN